MTEHYKKWLSPILGVETEMLVFGNAGYPVLLFPTSMGKYYQNKDFKLVDAVQWFVEKGLITIYCVDSIDSHSWYNKEIHPADRVKNHITYDRFIRDEIVPLIQQETGYEKIAVGGCSFGGYHATNFAFRHPDVVSFLMNMGAAYDIRNQMDGYYDENTYYNNPIDFLTDLKNSHLDQMGIILGIGEHDFCLNANIQLSRILGMKGINHWLDIRQGGIHDWPVWRGMFPDYIAEMLNKLEK
jgi:esterase/lipase superfamily enzyme